MVASVARAVFRRLRLLGLSLGRRLTLSQRFLIAAVLIVAIAMGTLGHWIGIYLQDGITVGVATTAASSIDSLVAHQIGEVTAGGVPTPEEAVRLAQTFKVGNEASSNRLLQIRIRATDGSVFYEATSGLEDATDEEPEWIEGALAGRVSARIVDVTVAPVGPIAGFPLQVLEIYTPLRRAGSDEVFAVAELYYGARSVLELRDKAQRDVWVLVGLIGALVIGVLFLLVDQASRTISTQRRRLAANLAASRRLSEENRALHDVSEQLRLNANFAHESLLARVGSDIHDGPIQMLALVILRLTKVLSPRNKGKSPEADLRLGIQAATDTMNELRDISTGLVLPELGELDLTATLELAISRHEDLTGTAVSRALGAMDATANVAAKICAYRVIQEALSNSFRHGGGVDQRVAATVSGHDLLLTISNARSTAAPEEASENPLGLRGMRFRVESLGGRLDVDLTGTDQVQVRASIPLGSPGDQLVSSGN